MKINQKSKIMKTSFSPHSTNKTTAVAMVNVGIFQPHYLINTGINEVIRSISRVISFSTAVVLSKKLGRNDVFIQKKCIFAFL